MFREPETFGMFTPMRPTHFAAFGGVALARPFGTT